MDNTQATDIHHSFSPVSHFEEQVIDARSLKDQAFAYMEQLEGWCSTHKANVFIDLILQAKPKILVEIGVFGGKSLIPMACAVKANRIGKVFGIDPWDPKCSSEGIKTEVNKTWWESLNHEQILTGLVKKIDQFGLKDHIELIRSTSADAPVIEEIGLLHIDGNHSEETSYFDVLKWVPLVKPGGLIIFDDINWCEGGIFTTMRAVQWLDDHCTKLVQFDHDSSWGVWIKK